MSIKRHRSTFCQLKPEIACDSDSVFKYSKTTSLQMNTVVKSNVHI